MNTNVLEREFKKKVCDQVQLLPRGLDQFVVLQPFTFDDGDHFVVVLRKEGPNWLFTDEGHTLMHVQYDDIDITHGTRASILDSVLSSFSVQNRSGELQIVVPEGRFGDAFYSFVQALNKISDLNFVRRELVRSMFMEDAKALIEELVPPDKRSFGYYDRERDPDENYKVDCRINGKARPDFVFFISNDYRCQNATIVCHQFERWDIEFRATGIFEDHTQINRRVLAQFSDVVYKQFPSLGSRERLRKYFKQEILSEEM